MSRWRRTVGVLLVGSVVLVGCGAGDGDEETSTPTTVAAATPDRVGGGAGEGSTGALTASDCATTSLAEEHGGTVEAMANLTEGLRGQLAMLEGYAAKAPPDLRADLRFVTETFADYIEVQDDFELGAAVAGVEPPPDFMARLRATAERLGSREFTEAAARVTAWVDKECGR